MRPSSSSVFAVFALAALVTGCEDPRMLLKVRRADTKGGLLVLACDTCDWTPIFVADGPDLERTVGLYFDGSSRTVVLRLQRTGDGSACTELKVLFTGSPRVLDLQLPADASQPASCEGSACPAATACGVHKPAQTCDPGHCLGGCCDGNGACWTAPSDTACGQDGTTCKDCTRGSGTCLPEGICSQDCAKTGTSCGPKAPCCAGLTCHQGACVLASGHGQPCDAATPCADGLTCNDTDQGGFCGSPQCLSAGLGCLLGDHCCDTAARCDGSCCFQGGHACSTASECCGGDCWNGCNPRSWVDGCLEPTCQSTETCTGKMGHCDPDRSDCCRPMRCYNTGSNEFPDYECWESWPP